MWRIIRWWGPCRLKCKMESPITAAPAAANNTRNNLNRQLQKRGDLYPSAHPETMDLRLAMQKML